MITFYAFKTIFEGGVGETKDLRVQWALEETGLPYHVHGLDQIAGELRIGSCINELRIPEELCRYLFSLWQK